MEHGCSALEDRPRPGSGPTGSRTGPRPPLAPHHRRRRAAAVLVAVALAALVAGIAVGAATSTSPPPADRAVVLPDGYFSRLKALAGGGAGSFVVGEERAENAAISRTLSYTPF